MKPFKDLIVVELASVLAGPAVGLFFAELGAQVIKIENKTTKGDVTRSWKLASEDKEHPYSAYYSSVNAGKTSRLLDLKNQHDFASLRQLIKKADLLIVNFKTGIAAQLKLDFQSVKQLNPHIIYGEITGFGKAKRTAYDIVLQAESGFLSMTGTPNNGELCKMPVALIDILAAHQLKEGLLLALLQQKKQKTALKVSVSLYDTALCSLANQATNWLMGKHIASPMGTLHPNIAPYGEVFLSKDQKKLVLAVGTNRQFENLCTVLQCNQLIKDKRFISNQTRVKHRSELATLLKEPISHHNRETLLTRFNQFNVPAGAIRNIKEVFDQPEAKYKIKRTTVEGEEMISLSGNAFTIET